MVCPRRFCGAWLGPVARPWRATPTQALHQAPGALYLVSPEYSGETGDYRSSFASAQIFSPPLVSGWLWSGRFRVVDNYAEG